MATILNRMARRVIFSVEPMAKEQIELLPGVVTKVYDEIVEKLQQRTYFNYFIQTGKIVVSKQETPMENLGIDIDPKTDKLSEKAPPADLLPPDTEKSDLGTKKGPSIKTVLQKIKKKD